MKRCASAVRLFEAQFNEVGKPTITTEFFLTEPLPEIDADAELLHHAFQNLVLNALDAMPAGGTLTLRTLERSRRHSHRSFGHRKRPDARRVLAPIYARITRPSSRELAGTGDRAIGRQRSPRNDFRHQRRKPRHDVSNRAAAAPDRVFSKKSAAPHPTLREPLNPPSHSRNFAAASD